MMKSFARPAIICGLASVLAFGAVGCTTETTTTTEISTTDEDGNTTTETTTTTTDGDGNTTTESTTTTDKQSKSATTDGDFVGYKNQYYKFAFGLPEGWTRTHTNPEVPAAAKVDYECANADNSAKALVMLVSGVTSQEGITDINSWTKTYSNAYMESLKESGITNLDATIGDFSIQGVDYGKYCLITGENAGAPIYADLYYILDADGDGCIIQFAANGEADIQTLRNSMATI